MTERMIRVRHRRYVWAFLSDARRFKHFCVVSGNMKSMGEEKIFIRRQVRDRSFISPHLSGGLEQ